MLARRSSPAPVTTRRRRARGRRQRERRRDRAVPRRLAHRRAAGRDPRLRRAGWAVAGPPGLCTLAARLGAFGAAARDRRVGHQRRAQHRPGDPALGNRRRRAHRAELRRQGPRRQRRGRDTVAVGHRGDDRARGARRARRGPAPVGAEPQRSRARARDSRRACAGRGSPRSARCAPRSVAAESDGHLQIELRAVNEQLPPDTDTALLRGRVTRRSPRSSESPRRGRRPAPHEVAERPVPGAPFDAVHAVPDAGDSRTLRSREQA